MLGAHWQKHSYMPLGSKIFQKQELLTCHTGTSSMLKLKQGSFGRGVKQGATAFGLRGDDRTMIHPQLRTNTVLSSNSCRFAVRKFWERAPKIVNSQKWSGEGVKGSLSSGGKSLPRVFCTIRDPLCTGATPFCTGATPFSLPGLKRPFAPSPNHFWRFSLSGLSPRTFGLQLQAVWSSLDKGWMSQCLNTAAGVAVRRDMYCQALADTPLSVTPLFQ